MREASLRMVVAARRAVSALRAKRVTARRGSECERAPPPVLAKPRTTCAAGAGEGGGARKEVQIWERVEMAEVREKRATKRVRQVVRSARVARRSRISGRSIQRARDSGVVKWAAARERKERSGRARSWRSVSTTVGGGAKVWEVRGSMFGQYMGSLEFVKMILRDLPDFVRGMDGVWE